jgi:hypothetical protein
MYQFAVIMASTSRDVLSCKEIDNALSEPFTDSDNSLFDSNNDSGVIHDIAVE